MSEGFVIYKVATHDREADGAEIKDVYVGNLVEIIDHDIQHIHDGQSFSVADTVAANTTTVKWMVLTPSATVYSHFVFTLTCTGEATFLVTEGANRTAGTSLNALNRRRTGSVPTALTTVSRTPTGGTTDGAITLFSMRNGITGQAGRSLETGNARATNEWVLAPETKYIISITTYADVYVSILLDWVEAVE